MREIPPTLFQLDVSSSRLKGSLPTEILEFSTLRLLNFDDNQLTGPILPELNKLSKLEHLGLGKNAFSGTLPSTLTLIQGLQQLSVSDNRLSGNLPMELADMPNLSLVNVANQESENKFSGPLLSFSSTSLNYLNMSMNAFTGTIPISLLSAVGVNDPISIDLSFNDLVGGIPVEYDTFQQLIFNLGANKIDVLPPQLCENLEWMGGITGVVTTEHRCDSILCRPGTYSVTGAQLHRAEPCKPCTKEDEAPYYGSVGCAFLMSSQEKNGL